MTLSVTTNVRKLFAPKKPPAAPAKQTTFQKNWSSHQQLQNDGLALIRGLPDMERLIDILSLNRETDAPGIHLLLERYLTRGFEIDEYDHLGNRFLSIPQPDGSPPRIAYTAHCDTMSTDKTSQYHKLQYNREKDVLFRTNGQCLGADDGTGIWLMLNMIDAQVPGLYCFYQDEETGRQGSEWSHKHDIDRYTGIDVMISFDRKGTSDIIATQRGDVCASDAFQDALADALTSECMGLKYKPGAAGSFTDSASFMWNIAECTNISVGYDLQHTPRETQLVSHVDRLRSTLCIVGHFFHHLLIAHRDPAEQLAAQIEEERLRRERWIGGGYMGGYNNGYGGYGGGAYNPHRPPANSQYQAEMEAMADAVEDDDAEEDAEDLEFFRSHATPAEQRALTHGSIEDIIELFPDAVADLLTEWGWEADVLADYIAQTFYGLNEVPRVDSDETH